MDALARGEIADQFKTQLKVGGINFQVVDVGDGPVVLLLHGFPNDHRLYKFQIPVLVKAGYRVVAPDLRGYGATDKPQPPDTYSIPNLIADVTGILDALSIKTCACVGHDWGAILGWGVAAALPERIRMYVALSCGHPDGWFAGPHRFDQLQLSWYMLLFQHKPAAEAAILGGSPVFRPQTREPKHPELLKGMFEDFAKPGAATAGLNWYRANINPESFTNKEGHLIATFPHVKVKVPVMGVYSPDFALAEDMMKYSENFIEPPGSWQYEFIDVDTHWLTWEASDELNKLLLTFLDKHAADLEHGKQQ